MKAEPKYTLVRHTGFSVSGKPGFKQAVELQSLTSTREIAAVARVGGLLFNTYSEASNREDSENFPPEVRGIYPQARGTFRAVKLGDEILDIYIPK